jgi:hypothetical protein
LLLVVEEEEKEKCFQAMLVRSQQGCVLRARGILAKRVELGVQTIQLLPELLDLNRLTARIN